MVTDFYKNHSLNNDSVTIAERQQATLVTSLYIQMRKKIAWGPFCLFIIAI